MNFALKLSIKFVQKSCLIHSERLGMKTICNALSKQKRAFYLQRFNFQIDIDCSLVVVAFIWNGSD